jgi:cyclopropane fatty-acyl-phospholipid synthase-like methyltransferase
MDKSNGYEGVAEEFIKVRGNVENKFGVSTVISWAHKFPPSSKILDLGCGPGIPISKVLIDYPMIVYGIDASPTLAAQFKSNFPHNEIRCEAVEDSSFYNENFDGIISWGLMFLLSPIDQAKLITKVSQHLKTGGKFLFTAPYQKAKWTDIMTGRESESLGKKEYLELLEKNGFAVTEGLSDEGGNYYYSCTRM